MANRCNCWSRKPCFSIAATVESTPEECASCGGIRTGRIGGNGVTGYLDSAARGVSGATDFSFGLRPGVVSEMAGAGPCLR